MPAIPGSKIRPRIRILLTCLLAALVLLAILAIPSYASISAPGFSDCCSSHPGIGCDDPVCEQTVCAVDPFCCDPVFGSWDGLCAQEACDLCGSLCNPCAREVTSVWFVDLDRPGGLEDGRSWATAFDDLREALESNEVLCGDEIWVADGVYTTAAAGTKSYFLPSGVRVYGGFQGNSHPQGGETGLAERDPALYKTVLSADLQGDDVEGDFLNHRGDNRSFIVQVQSTVPGTLLDGFTLHGAHSLGTTSPLAAILIRNGSFTLRGSVVRDNFSATHGGGIYMELRDGDAVVLEDNVILGNRVEEVAVQGAGLYAQGSGTAQVTIEGCTFAGNVAAGIASSGGGATLRLHAASVSHSLFSHNQATNLGGAIFTPTIPVPVELADLDCDAMPQTQCAETCDPKNRSLTIDNTLLVYNSVTSPEGFGGAVFVFDTDLTITSSTLSRNSGPTAALFALHACVEIDNSILWDNGADQVGIYGGATVEVASSDADPGSACAGGVSPCWLYDPVTNVTLDPEFRDPDGADDLSPTWQDNDFRLSCTSPLIDRGDNDLLAADLRDLDGDGDTAEPVPFDLDGAPRRVDDPAVEPDPGRPGVIGPPVTDLGAYELQPLSCCSGSLLAAEPPDGTLDARQPHPVNTLTPLQGIGSAEEPIRLTLSSTGVERAHCWDLCETGSGNGIASLGETSPGVYEMVLDRPLTPGEWSTLTYLGDGSQVTWGALPADASGDRFSGSADIGSYIDCCLNLVCTPPHGLYSCNIDHSGPATVLDLSRLIDLLNGAGTFESWIGRQLPAVNSCLAGQGGGQ